MVKLQELEQALRKLHPEEGKQGPAFSLTSNNTLLGPAPFDAFMLIPFHRWEDRRPPKENGAFSKNVIAESFKEVLDAGLPAEGTSIKKGEVFLIDLALLDEPHHNFMRDSHMTDYLAVALKEKRLEEAKVVIRLLIGSHDQGQLRDKFLDDTGKEHDGRLEGFRNIFWPDGKNPAVKHGDVTLLIGYYNPSLILAKERKKDGALDKLDQVFAPFKDKNKGTDSTNKPKRVALPNPVLVRRALTTTTKKEEPSFWDQITGAVTDAWGWVKDKASTITTTDVWAVLAPLVLVGIQIGSPGYYSLVMTFINKYPEFEKNSRKKGWPAMSWNHAKYAAVNGKAMMTGGFNYWDDYLRNNETDAAQVKDVDDVLIDFGIKMKGDAALSVHAFADEIWGYLKTMNPDMDKRSMAWKVNLASSMPEAKFVAAGPDDIPTGLFDKVVIQPATGATAGSFQVLTTARVGSMQLDDYRYPSQLLDAFRDIALNVTWHRYEAQRKPEDDHGNAVAELVAIAELLLEGTPSLASVVGTHAAAWASKYARLYAIKNAKTSIHMTAQTLVDRLAFDDWKGHDSDKAKNKGVVDDLNGAMGFTDAQAWDGDIWPYDLLSAFSKALSRLAKLPAPTPTEQGNAQGAAIYIVLSSKDTAYGDPTSLQELKKRLKAVFKSMASRSANYLPEKTAEADVDDIVEKRFLVKRPLKGLVSQKLHAKTMCVDREAVYVGSDNAYPHYNEEFGCWVEDRAIVDSFLTGFFDGLWKDSLVVKDGDLDE
ncbi:hypothetical protein B0H66DRAFT_378894 [Apodospora peruviana]|uniref:PLD phosphodiesterase domain-containing protein n=1 Tax=Apodospora peruviana TaxID=516989 RepID=A0AAE0HTM2_9PEZI|nr:hypothetical protein B0H66DRAFT_378894 [Apodospora peruviana]